MQCTGCAFNRAAAITESCRVDGVEAMEKVDGTKSGRTSHELQRLSAAHIGNQLSRERKHCADPLDHNRPLRAEQSQEFDWVVAPVEQRHQQHDIRLVE